MRGLWFFSNTPEVGAMWFGRSTPVVYHCTAYAAAITRGSMKLLTYVIRDDDVETLILSATDAAETLRLTMDSTKVWLHIESRHPNGSDMTTIIRIADITRMCVTDVDDG